MHIIVLFNNATTLGNVYTHEFVVLSNGIHSLNFTRNCQIWDLATNIKDHVTKFVKNEICSKRFYIDTLEKRRFLNKQEITKWAKIHNYEIIEIKRFMEIEAIY